MTIALGDRMVLKDVLLDTILKGRRSQQFKSKKKLVEVKVCV